MKRSLTMFMALLVAAAFSACSSDPADNEAGSSQNEPALSGEQSGSGNNQEKEERLAAESKGPDYEKEGLPVPQGYPEDLVPLMAGYKVVSGSTGRKGDKQEIWLKYMVDAGLAEAGLFYRDVLSRGNLQEDQKLGTGLYMLKGELAGKAVDVKISNEIMFDNYQSNVMITIVGDASEPEETASGAVTLDLSAMKKSIAGIDQVPADYPMDLVPLYGSEIKYADKSEYNGKTIFLIQVYAEEDKGKVFDFYKQVLRSAKDKEEGTVSTGSHTIGGVMANYKTSILIADMDIAGSKFKSFSTIQLDVLE